MPRKKTNTFYSYGVQYGHPLPYEVVQAKNRLLEKAPESEHLLDQFVKEDVASGQVFFSNLTKAYNCLKLNLERNTPPGTLYKLPSYAYVYRIIKARGKYVLSAKVPLETYLPGTPLKLEFLPANYIIKQERMF